MSLHKHQKKSKVCTKCRKKKSIKYFNEAKTKSGYSGSCKKCLAEKAKNRNKQLTGRHYPLLGFKNCLVRGTIHHTRGIFL
jgi:hypothetical protein